MTEPLRTETDDRVRVITLTRADEYNTINPALRDALADALDDADRDRGVHAVLLRAEGPAFCAGYQLDWATSGQAAAESAGGRVWDSVADLQGIGQYASTWAKLHTISKPTIAAVQGWCIAGGTNMVLNADLIVCSESARFGYPPMRVWGIPEAPWVWIARLGLERAKRYLFTGDEISGAEAARLGLVLECVATTSSTSTRARSRTASRCLPARAAPDDQVGAQRHRPRDVRARHVADARLPVRRRGPPHPRRARLRRAFGRRRVPPGRARARRPVRRLRQPAPFLSQARFGRRDGRSVHCSASPRGGAVW